jgi:hypothetical protein
MLLYIFAHRFQREIHYLWRSRRVGLAELNTSPISGRRRVVGVPLGALGEVLASSNDGDTTAEAADQQIIDRFVGRRSDTRVNQRLLQHLLCGGHLRLLPDDTGLLDTLLLSYKLTGRFGKSSITPERSGTCPV